MKQSNVVIAPVLLRTKRSSRGNHPYTVTTGANQRQNNFFVKLNADEITCKGL